MKYLKISALILSLLLFTSIILIKRMNGNVHVEYFLVFLFFVVLPTGVSSGTAKNNTSLIKPISLGIILSMTAGISISHIHTELAMAFGLMVGIFSILFFVHSDRNINTQSDIGANVVYGSLPSIYFGSLAGYIGLSNIFTFPLITLGMCTIFLEYYLTFTYSKSVT